MRDSYSDVRGCEGARIEMGVRGRGPRMVKKGEVVLRSTPFAHVIDAPYLGIYCDTCIASSRDILLYPCSECRTVWYCSEKCRDEALVWHRLECITLRRRQHNLPPNYVRLMARVLLRLRNGGDKLVEKYSEREGRRFRDLMSHYVDIKNSKAETRDAEYLREELGKLIGERHLPNMTDFLGIYGRILVNRFSLMDKTLLNIGSAVYLAASIFDHDCFPNCYIAFHGRNIEIRSLIDIPNFEYSKCRIAYLDPVRTAAARRQDLYKKWFFFCECKTCNDEERRRLENSVICDNPQCNATVTLPNKDPDILIEAAIKRKVHERDEDMTNGRKKEREKEEKTSVQEEGREENGEEEKDGGLLLVRCEECGCEVTEERQRQYWDVVFFTKEKLKKMTEEDPSMEDCLEMMERQTDLLSNLNAWRVRTLDFAFNGAMFRGCWSLALKYGEENQEGMRFYYGPRHPVYGLYLFKLGKAKIYFKEFREGVRILEEADAILTVAIGDSHPVLEDLRLVSLMANEDIEICLERRLAKQKKREQEQQAVIIQQPDNISPHKTFPWISSEKDVVTNGLLHSPPSA